MNIIDVTTHNRHVYENLAQCYEAEFSALTRKQPNASGIFALDTIIETPTRAFLLYIEEIPAGLAAIGSLGNDHYEVCEFYIVPYYREEKWGTKFAHDLWQKLPGNWEVKQIAGADYATLFWQSCIHAYPHENYQEATYEDTYWGRVNRQCFTTA